MVDLDPTTYQMGTQNAYGCRSSSSSSESPKSDEGDNSAKTCTEPENPYQEGSGHYAGWEWAAQNGGSCDGNSQSFNEGCEEYQHQEDGYEKCKAKQ